MVLVAFQLMRPVARLRGKEMGFAIVTGVLGAVVSMAVGALVGVVGYHLWERLSGREAREGNE
jgi:hypothetical protein